MPHGYRGCEVQLVLRARRADPHPGRRRRPDPARVRRRPLVHPDRHDGDGAGRRRRRSSLLRATLRPASSTSRCRSMDGFELLESASARTDSLSNLPVIMLTGREDIASIDRAFTLGATHSSPSRSTGGCSAIRSATSCAPLELSVSQPGELAPAVERDVGYAKPHREGAKRRFPRRAAPRRSPRWAMTCSASSRRRVAKRKRSRYVTGPRAAPPRNAA